MSTPGEADKSDRRLPNIAQSRVKDKALVVTAVPIVITVKNQCRRCYVLDIGNRRYFSPRLRVFPVRIFHIPFSQVPVESGTHFG